MKAKKAIKKVPVKTAKKVQESGHAKNVSNLGTLISAAVSFGIPYNPANPKQTITSMQTVFTNGTNDKNAVFTALKPYQDAISKRAVDFRKAKTFLSRIVGAAKSLELSDDSILKIKGYIRKIRGTRAVPVVVPPVTDSAAEPDQTGTDVKTHSVAQTSYTNLADHYFGLNSVLLAEPKYIPNETDLTTDTITAMITNLEQDNKDSETTFFTLNGARTKRNVTLYKDKSGLVDVGNGAKEYIKSVFGITSSQFKQVSKIKFVTFVNEL